MSNEPTPAKPAETPSPAAPSVPSAGAPAAAAKPAPPSPPPPDPKVLAWRAELERILGGGAVWDLKGTLPAFRVAASDLRVFAQKLKDAGFDYCLLMTATDYVKENRFEMVYVLTSFANGREAALVADVDRSNPAIDTVSDLWPTAEWHEREAYDLFGITFRGHADLRRILLDDSWSGHPLRKDYVDTVHEMVKRPY